MKELLKSIDRVPLFEIYDKNRRWKIYADGRLEGFPKGCGILNRASPAFSALIGKIRELERSDCIQGR
jgi:hypothetical protein